MKLKIFSSIIIISLTFFMSVEVIAYNSFFSEETSDSKTNYFTLEKLYFNWQKGIYGSKGYYRSKLKSFLIELINKEIHTMDDFFLVTPESIQKKQVRCKLRSGKWLYFHGPVDASDLKKILKKRPRLLRKWWRSTLLFSISGRIEKFKLGRDPYGDVIDLHLYKIKIIFKEKKNKKKKK